VTDPSLRKLALGDLDDETLQGLIAHGEDLFVERKRQLPEAPKFGAAVSSFANTLGGWVLLGVDDDGTICGFPTSDRLDLQTWLAEELRKQTDPLPPFVAGAREFDGRQVVLLRVFESADSPHIVRGTGAIYVRTTKGKEPVDDHRTLIELARRGEEAERRARQRLSALPLVTRAVELPVDLVVRDQQNISVLALAAPLTVTPQFTDWPISRRAAEWCATVTERILPAPEAVHVRPQMTVEPAPRGVIATGVLRSAWDHDQRDEVCLVADSGGVIAGRFKRMKEGRELLLLDRLRADTLEPLLRVLAEALAEAEAFGRSAWDVFVLLPHEIRIPDEQRGAQRIVHMGAELTIPASDDEVAGLAHRLMREYARGAGLRAWEGAGG